MKTAFTIILALALAGCASSRRAGGAREKAARIESGGRYERAPFVGMTKAQALARYGEPRRRVLTEQGERWYYVLNRTEVARKALNPLALRVPKYRAGVLLFGANDKVKRFAWEPKN